MVIESLSLIDRKKIIVQIREQMGSLLLIKYGNDINDRNIIKIRNDYISGVLNNKYSVVEFSNKKTELLEKKSFLDAVEISKNTGIDKIIVNNYLRSIKVLSDTDSIDPFELDPKNNTKTSINTKINKYVKYISITAGAVVLYKILK